MARKTSICIEITEQERSQLERLARSLTASHRSVVRAKIILMIAAGNSISGTAQQVMRGRRIVLKWARRFICKRLDGLKDDPRSGHPPLFSPGGGNSSYQTSV
jgi:hypothetical protein